MNVRHGLSHREATPIDPPHPLSVHCSQGQLAGLRAKTLQQGGLDLAGREIDPLVRSRGGVPEKQRDIGAEFAEAGFDDLVGG